jgi:hypothetical protein
MGPSERSKVLQAQLEGKEITLKEFFKECAYWALMEGFEELKPKTLPSRPPRVVEIERYTLKERQEADWFKLFIENPEIKGYYDQLHYVINWNKGVKEWLEELLTYIPEGDIPSRKKLTERLKEFTDDSELEKVKEIFSGSVLGQAKRETG